MPAALMGVPWLLVPFPRKIAQLPAGALYGWAGGRATGIPLAVEVEDPQDQLTPPHIPEPNAIRQMRQDAAAHVTACHPFMFCRLSPVARILPCKARRRKLGASGT